MIAASLFLAPGNLASFGSDHRHLLCHDSKGLDRTVSTFEDESGPPVKDRRRCPRSRGPQDLEKKMVPQVCGPLTHCKIYRIEELIADVCPGTSCL